MWAQEPAKAFPWELEQIQVRALALQSDEELVELGPVLAPELRLGCKEVPDKELGPELPAE